MPERLAYTLADFPAISAPAGMARLQARVPAGVSSGRALHVLGPGRAAWLGEPVEDGPEAGGQRHLVDLELRVGEQTPRITFRKAAYVDVGPLVALSDDEFAAGLEQMEAAAATDTAREPIVDHLDLLVMR